MKKLKQPLFCLQFWSHRPQRAFSLHDALVSLAVVSTVATVAVPSFQKIVSSQRMSGAINTLVTALYLARSEAIKRREAAVLCPSTDGRTCTNRGQNWDEGYLLYIDHNENREIDADETVIRVFDATPGLQLRNISQHDHVRYLPNGMATLTNATFTFCPMHGQGTPKAVIISNSGRARTSTRLPGGGAIACPDSR